MCDEHHIATLIHLFLHFCRNEGGIVVHGWQGAWTADVGSKTHAGKEQGADGDVVGFGAVVVGSKAVRRVKELGTKRIVVSDIAMVSSWNLMWRFDSTIGTKDFVKKTCV